MDNCEQFERFSPESGDPVSPPRDFYFYPDQPVVGLRHSQSGSVHEIRMSDGATPDHEFSPTVPERITEQAAEPVEPQPKRNEGGGQEPPVPPDGPHSVGGNFDNQNSWENFLAHEVDTPRTPSGMPRVTQEAVDMLLDAFTGNPDLVDDTLTRMAMEQPKLTTTILNYALNSGPTPRELERMKEVFVFAYLALEKQAEANQNLERGD